MAALFTNNASSTLLSSISNTATVLFCQVTDQGLFPEPILASDYFMVVLEDRTQNPVVREIVKCTARTGNQFTVVRAQEGTAAVAWTANVTVSHRITAATLATLANGTSGVNQLYLGAFATAPTQTLEHTVLVPGNLYYDTTSLALYQYNGVSWQRVTNTTSTIALGIYLGQFTVPPITMADGSALVPGTLYYSTSIPGLQIYTNGAWGSATSATVGSPTTPTTANVVDGNLTVTGNIIDQGTGTFTNLVVTDDTSTGTLHLGGKLVVDAGDVSGGTNSQNFPSGTSMLWGIALTGTNGLATIQFVPAFKTQCTQVQLTLQSWPVNCTIEIDGVPSATGFTVYCEDTDNHGGVATGFHWLALGN